MLRLAAPALLVLLLSGCASTGSTDLTRAEADPWEKSNRRMFAFNKLSLIHI